MSVAGVPAVQEVPPDVRCLTGSSGCTSIGPVTAASCKNVGWWCSATSMCTGGRCMIARRGMHEHGSAPAPYGSRLPR